MKILRFCICALLSIGIAICVVPAEALVNNTCETGPPGTTVFYGNGVSVTGGNQVFQDAKILLSILQDALESAVVGTSIELGSRYYCIAWNPSGGLLLDLFQSVKQLILDDWSQFWRYLGNLDLAPDSFRSLAVKIAASVDSLSFVNDPDLQTQVAMYRAQLGAGRKIVVVGHSQGNFYANEANNILYNGLDGQPLLRTKSFGVVAVAEPANNVAGKDRPYTTLLTDSVILAVIASAERAGLPLPLLPNTLDFCIGLCHVFAEPYLKEGTNSRRKILIDVIDVIEHLEIPSTSLGIACGNPPQGVVGTPYSHSFPATGGTTPYTFSILNGNLPTGLSLDEDIGAVTGTPASVGTFTFTTQVTDSNASNRVIAANHDDDLSLYMVRGAGRDNNVQQKLGISLSGKVGSVSFKVAGSGSMANMFAIVLAAFNDSNYTELFSYYGDTGMGLVAQQEPTVLTFNQEATLYGGAAGHIVGMVFDPTKYYLLEITGFGNTSGESYWYGGAALTYPQATWASGAIGFIENIFFSINTGVSTNFASVECSITIIRN